jgi:oligoendopeptidase F
MEELMNKEWNLDILYSGFDDPKYSEDTELLTKEIEALGALSSDISNIEEEKLVSEYIAISEKLNLLASKLGIFANLKYSANTKDAEAASALGRLMGMLSATAAPSTKISQAIAQISDLDAIIAKNPTLDEYRYMLGNIQRDSKHLLSDKEEELFAKMNISGAGAWSDLHSSLTSSVTATVDGKEIPLSSVRNLAYSPDPETRKKAYEAELACYDKIKDSVAFALNSIKLQVLNECEMRGYESPLAKTL